MAVKIMCMYSSFFYRCKCAIKSMSLCVWSSIHAMVQNSGNEWHLIRFCDLLVYSSTVRPTSSVIVKAVVKTTFRFRFDCDSTDVRLPFDCNSTVLRPFDDLRYDRKPTLCVGCLLTCGLNKL